MSKHWGAIESDFQREYGIDLLYALDDITWRRFQTLMNHLSPDSLTQRLLAKQEKKRKEEEKRRVKSQEEANKVFLAVAGEAPFPK